MLKTKKSVALLFSFLFAVMGLIVVYSKIENYVVDKAHAFSQFNETDDQNYNTNFVIVPHETLITYQIGIYSIYNNQIIYMYICDDEDDTFELEYSQTDLFDLINSDIKIKGHKNIAFNFSGSVSQDDVFYLDSLFSLGYGNYYIEGKISSKENGGFEILNDNVNLYLKDNLEITHNANNAFIYSPQHLINSNIILNGAVINSGATSGNIIQSHSANVILNSGSIKANLQAKNNNSLISVAGSYIEINQIDMTQNSDSHPAILALSCDFVLNGGYVTQLGSACAIETNKSEIDSEAKKLNKTTISGGTVKSYGEHALYNSSNIIEIKNNFEIKNNQNAQIIFSNQTIYDVGYIGSRLIIDREHLFENDIIVFGSDDFNKYALKENNEFLRSGSQEGELILYYHTLNNANKTYVYKISNSGLKYKAVSSYENVLFGEYELVAETTSDLERLIDIDRIKDCAYQPATIDFGVEFILPSKMNFSHGSYMLTGNVYADQNFLSDYAFSIGGGAKVEVKNFYINLTQNLFFEISDYSEINLNHNVTVEHRSTSDSDYLINACGNAEVTVIINDLSLSVDGIGAHFNFISSTNTNSNIYLNSGEIKTAYAVKINATGNFAIDKFNFECMSLHFEINDIVELRENFLFKSKIKLQYKHELKNEIKLLSILDINSIDAGKVVLVNGSDIVLNDYMFTNFYENVFGAVKLEKLYDYTITKSENGFTATAYYIGTSFAYQITRDSLSNLLLELDNTYGQSISIHFDNIHSDQTIIVPNNSTISGSVVSGADYAFVVNENISSIIKNLTVEINSNSKCAIYASSDKNYLELNNIKVLNNGCLIYIDNNANIMFSGQWKNDLIIFSSQPLFFADDFCASRNIEIYLLHEYEIKTNKAFIFNYYNAENIMIIKLVDIEGYIVALPVNNYKLIIDLENNCLKFSTAYIKTHIYEITFDVQNNLYLATSSYVDNSKYTLSHSNLFVLLEIIKCDNVLINAYDEILTTDCKLIFNSLPKISKTITLSLFSTNASVPNTVAVKGEINSSADVIFKTVGNFNLVLQDITINGHITSIAIVIESLGDIEFNNTKINSMYSVARNQSNKTILKIGGDFYSGGIITSDIQIDFGDYLSNTVDIKYLNIGNLNKEKAIAKGVKRDLNFEFKFYDYAQSIVEKENRYLNVVEIENATVLRVNDELYFSKIFKVTIVNAKEQEQYTLSFLDGFEMNINSCVAFEAYEVLKIYIDINEDFIISDSDIVVTAENLVIDKDYILLVDLSPNMYLSQYDTLLEGYIVSGFNPLWLNSLDRANSDLTYYFETLVMPQTIHGSNGNQNIIGIKENAFNNNINTYKIFINVLDLSNTFISVIENNAFVNTSIKDIYMPDKLEVSSSTFGDENAPNNIIYSSVEVLKLKLKSTGDMAFKSLLTTIIEVEFQIIDIVYSMLYGREVGCMYDEDMGYWQKVDFAMPILENTITHIFAGWHINNVIVDNDFIINDLVYNLFVNAILNSKIVETEKENVSIESETGIDYNHELVFNEIQSIGIENGFDLSLQEKNTTIYFAWELYLFDGHGIVDYTKTLTVKIKLYKSKEKLSNFVLLQIVNGQAVKIDFIEHENSIEFKSFGLGTFVMVANKEHEGSSTFWIWAVSSTLVALLFVWLYFIVTRKVAKRK